jgi:hypothetical protein
MTNLVTVRNNYPIDYKKPVNYDEFLVMISENVISMHSL